jgi:hypothetical protein
MREDGETDSAPESETSNYQQGFGRRLINEGNGRIKRGLTKQVKEPGLINGKL